MRILIWVPLIVALGWLIWDWGRIRYLLGRTDAFDEITGFILDRTANEDGFDGEFAELDPSEKVLVFEERTAIFREISKRWAETNPAFIDPKRFPIPKR